MNREMIDEFKKLVLEEYNEELTDDNAAELAQNLLNVYRIVYRQPPKKVAFVLNDESGLKQLNKRSGK